MVSVEQLVILILVCALAAKYIFFEDREEITEQLNLKSTTIDQSGIMASRIIIHENGMKHVQSMSDFQADAVHKKKPIFILPGCEDNEDKETQTEEDLAAFANLDLLENNPVALSHPVRLIDECLELFKTEGAQVLSDEEVILLVNNGHIPLYKLEAVLADDLRGVKLRRQIIGLKGGFPNALDGLPYLNYDYSKVSFILL